MGAKQRDDYWCIFPCCHECNHRPRSKFIHWVIARTIGGYCGIEEDIARNFYLYEHELSMEQSNRVYQWAESLKNAREGKSL